MKRLFKFCMLLFLCFHIGNAQENSIKHKVSLGETIIDIAKKYNVTPYDIQQANLGTVKSLDEIKENDVLIIPESKIKSPQLESAADAIKSSVASKTLTYTVKKGETKYGLAKRFGITIPELEARNPHIIAGLNEGHVLNVNTSVENLPEPAASVVEKKPTNVTFDGYKNHLVLKGETLWGISHANGLTVEQLVGENTEILTGILREGQTLKVPQVNEDNLSHETYVVKYGDTKYGLSKKYETTIEELERLNPHIVTMLQAGHTIRIPSEEAVKTASKNASVKTIEIETPNDVIPEKTNQTDTNETLDIKEKKEQKNQESVATVEVETIKNPVSEPEIINSEIITQENNSTENYVSYEIKPKETLYGLSKKAGMSIADFVVLNPQLKESVQIGTIIKMPKTDTLSDGETVYQKSVPSSNLSKYRDLAKTINYTNDKKLLFFLPFNQAKFNDEMNRLVDFKNVTNDFQRKHLEFYSGATLAIDSLKRLGLNVDVTVLEVENSKRNSKIKAMIEDFKFQDYDAVVLPFYENIEEDLATMVAENRIPVITAATISHQQNVDNLFSALPSTNQQRKKVLDYMISKQGNIIVISDVNRSESKDFIAEYVPYAKFVDLKKNGTFSENDLISTFIKDKLNFVILDSDRNSVFLNVTNVLLSELNNFSLQLAVLEPSIIPDNDDVSVKRFRILKMLYPSLTPVDSNLKAENLKSIYKKTFNLPPTTNALFGFDITFDTLLRLAQESTFEASAKKDITEYNNLKFEYKLNTSGGYSNDGIYILQYDTNSNLQEAD